MFLQQRIYCYILIHMNATTNGNKWPIILTLRVPLTGETTQVREKMGLSEPSVEIGNGGRNDCFFSGCDGLPARSRKISEPPLLGGPWSILFRVFQAGADFLRLILLSAEA